MRVQTIAGFSFNFFGFGSYAILIPFLKKGFAATDQQVGIFLGIAAVGAVAGASFAAKYSRRWPFGKALTTAYLLDAFLFIPVVITNNIWIAAAFWAASNTLANFEIAQIIGFRMRVSPEEMIGRVMGAVRLIVLSSMAPGVLIFGYIADKYSPHAAMWIGCVGFIVVALGAFAVRPLREETR
jgi:MFS family permease